ncbi:hypothetical protein B296_00025852 [Ensete ventricosum]|uniref:RING-type domain-containing protein n=1 Tax=Ensete ventricosum TaxID=4639 RepID=A0A426Z5J8_ENSVE|nr:hypothetical protein B296_00025852 [Ensete ventricosum]
MAAQDAQPFRWHYDALDDKNFHVRGRGLLFLLISFTILLFFTLICLYVRWACRHRPHWGAETSPLSMSSAATSHRTTTGLDPRIIDSFPVHLHRDLEAGEEAQCSICLSSLTEGDKVKALPNCGHTFDVECVDEWLKAHTSCPLCRASLADSSVAVEPGAAIISYFAISKMPPAWLIVSRILLDQNRLYNCTRNEEK